MQLAEQEKSKLVKRFETIYRQWFNGKTPKIDLESIQTIVDQEKGRYGGIGIPIVNGKAPKIFQAFLADKHLFDSVSGLSDLVRISIRASIDVDYLSNTVIKVGMGGSIDPVSIRLPAQILGAIVIIENLLDLKEDNVIKSVPIVHVFKAEYASFRVNGFLLNEIKPVTEQTFSFLRAYLKKFHPRVNEYFFFDTDKKWDDGTVSVLEHITDFLSQKVDSDLNDNLSFRRILKMGQNRGGDLGKKNSLLYVSSHSLYQEDFITPIVTDLFVKRKFLETSYPNAVINIGGQPEKDFYELRMFIMDNMLDGLLPYTPLNVQFFTKICRLITYGSARDGDILLKDAELLINQDYREQIIQNNRLIINDVKALEGDTLNRIWDFARHFNLNYRGQ